MDNIVHPQKRMDVKKVLELVIYRLIVLKHLLIKWNPPYPALGRGPFPYDTLNLDDVLVDLKLPASILEIKIPKYFVEDRKKEIDDRNKLVNAYYYNTRGTKPKVLQVDLLKFVSETLPLKLEDAIALIQKNERGRQGKKRAQLMKKLLKEEDNKSMFGIANPKPDEDPEVAALDIQRVWRSFHTRKQIREEEDEELIYIGMRHPPDVRTKKLIKDTINANRKRKVIQHNHEEEYKQSLDELKQKVKDEEGPEMREKMLDDRREWFLKQLETGVTPEDLSTYYDPPPPPDPDADKKKKQAAKQAAKPQPAAKKTAPAAKNKNEAPPPEMPKNLCEIVNTKEVADMNEKYHKDWDNNEFENKNFEQQYDPERAKGVVRPTVEEEVKEQVDNLMLLQLQNIKTVLDSKKKKKKKKGRKKKAKKPKKPKGKKLPGAKYCKGMENEQMLSILTEKEIIINYEKHTMDEFLGEMNYLGTMYQNSGLTEVYDANGDTRTAAIEPSLANIRQNLREYATLPLGCPTVKSQLTPEYNVKSIFLYGPHGSGKTMLAQAIATETGAMMMDISYDRIANCFPGKNGIMKIMHMIFQVAREPKWGPTVLYMEDLEVLYGAAKGKKKKQKKAEGRYKKALLKYLKTLDPVEQVIVIGCARQAWLIPEKNIKNVKALFEKTFYCPFPDYASMIEIWKSMIEKKLQHNLPKKFTVSNLARISTGYTAGAVQYAVDSTLTERRIYHIDGRPLLEKEFITSLAQYPLQYEDDYKKYHDFFRIISGVKEEELKELRRKEEEEQARKKRR